MSDGIGPLTPAERDAFLRELQIAVIATTARSGPPHLTPVWYAWDGSQFKLALAEGSVKTRNLNRSNEFSLCLDKRSWPYMSVIARCRVSSSVTQQGYPDELAERYLDGETLASFRTANQATSWRVVYGAPFEWAGHINRSGRDDSPVESSPPGTPT